MNIKKIFTAALIATGVMILSAVPAFAAQQGWANENGQYVYYDNGVKVTNKWVAGGATYYYVNSLGYTGKQWSLPSDVAAYAKLDVVPSSIGSIDPALLPAVTIPVVTPSVVPVVPSTPYVPAGTLPPYIDQAAAAALVPNIGAIDYSIATPEQIARYEDNLYSRHYYNCYYEYIDHDTHRAYCGCGESIISGHNLVDFTRKDGRKTKRCTLCQ